MEAASLVRRQRPASSFTWYTPVPPNIYIYIPICIPIYTPICIHIYIFNYDYLPDGGRLTRPSPASRLLLQLIGIYSSQYIYTCIHVFEYTCTYIYIYTYNCNYLPDGGRLARPSPASRLLLQLRLPPRCAGVHLARLSPNEFKVRMGARLFFS